jgi:hypothetical protein
METDTLTDGGAATASCMYAANYTTLSSSVLRRSRLALGECADEMRQRWQHFQRALLPTDAGAGGGKHLGSAIIHNHLAVAPAVEGGASVKLLGGQWAEVRASLR